MPPSSPVVLHAPCIPSNSCIPILSLYSHTFPAFPHIPCIPVRSLYSRTLLYSRTPGRAPAVTPQPSVAEGQSQPVFEAVPGTGGSHGHSVTKGHLHRPGSAAAIPSRRAESVPPSPNAGRGSAG